MPLDKVYPAHVESSSYDTYIARYLTKIPDPPYLPRQRGVSSTVCHFGTGKKRKIPFQVTKRSKKSYPICFSDPRPRNYAWFHLLFLTHHNFIKPESQKRKIPFLVTKRNQKCNFTHFCDLRLPSCSFFHITLIQK